MKNRRTILFLIILMALLAVYGCSALTSTVVVLNREYYTPSLNPAQYKHLHGKRILFGSIEDQSTNTSNLNYFSPDRSVSYKLYYTSPQNSVAQPVVSFLWYALKKGFERTGVVIVEGGPLYDAELYMTITSLTDEEIRFNALLKQRGSELYKKNYAVRVPGGKMQDPAALEDRAYAMLDAMVKAILADAEAPLSGLSPEAISEVKASAASVGLSPPAGKAPPELSQNQTVNQWKMLLSNNEEIWDLNGMWDAEYEFYGREGHRGVRLVRFQISQHGRVFEARLTRDYSLLRSVAVTGELFSGGIKRATEHTGVNVQMKGQVSEKGKVLLFDNGETFRLKCTRRLP